MTKKTMIEILNRAFNEMVSSYDSQKVTTFKMKKETMLNGETWYFINAIVETVKTFGKHKSCPVRGQYKTTLVYNKNTNELMNENWEVIYKAS